MWWKSLILYVCLMATVKYRLEKPTGLGGLKKKEVAIYCRVTLDRNNRFEFSTKLRVPPTYWNPELQEVKSHFNGSKVINIALSKLKTELLELWNSNKSLSIEELRSKSIAFIRYGEDPPVVQKKRTAEDLKEFICEFIKKCDAGTINRKPNTIQTYKATFEHLCWFSEYSERPLTFAAITLDFYYDFCQYCWDILGHEDSTLGKSIKILKMFMQEAQSMDLHNNMAFRKKQFRKLEGQSDSIYLTEDEIQKIYNLDLSGNRKLEESRDLFVLSCHIGLRYSDLRSIQPHHIKDDTIRIRTQKTGEDVVIPLHPTARAIVAKYQNVLPEARSNPEYNQDVKAIGALAKITGTEQRRRIVRNTATFEPVDRYDMITAHTARRSFATNCYKMGVPTRSIMAITGHKTEKAFNKYIKLSKDEHATIMMEHFNQSFKAQMKVSA
jgi:integrase